MTNKNLEQHPLSAVMPPMSEERFASFRSSIAKNGLRNPIILYEGKILDGWHRQKACIQTGSETRYEEFTGDYDDALNYVSDIIEHRDLNTSQRAMIAARLAGMKRGRPDKSVLVPNSSQKVVDLAHKFNLSEKTVGNAKTVLDKGTPEIIAKVESGEVPVTVAARDIRAAMPRPVKPAAPPTAPAMPALTLLPPPPIIEPRTIAQWNSLSEDDKLAHLNFRNSKSSLNRQESGEDDNSIDWAKWTWNPITGCLHSCPYCYARDIAERFEGTPAFPNGFEPTFLPHKLAAPLNGKPRVSDDPRERRIFTGSMSDIFGRWVPAEWINAVLDVMRQASQWEFLMLTKFPKRMSEFEIPSNVWMGTSVDCQARVNAAESAFEKVSAKVKWLSVEPMIEPIKFKNLDRFNLLVIGGASKSNQTPQWIPPFTWIDDLMRQAEDAKCSVFLKSNLYRKEEPGGYRYKILDRAPDVFHYLSKASDPNKQVNAA